MLYVFDNGMSYDDHGHYMVEAPDNFDKDMVTLVFIGAFTRKGYDHEEAPHLLFVAKTEQEPTPRGIDPISRVLTADTLCASDFLPKRGGGKNHNGEVVKYDFSKRHAAGRVAFILKRNVLDLMSLDMLVFFLSSWHGPGDWSQGDEYGPIFKYAVARFGEAWVTPEIRQKAEVIKISEFEEAQK